MMLNLTWLKSVVTAISHDTFFILSCTNLFISLNANDIYDTCVLFCRCVRYLRKSQTTR